jgi:hypothetical protein
MNASTPSELALDAALARALRPPTLPADFHARLRAGIARDPEELRREQCQNVEGEWRELRAELRRSRLQMGLGALGALTAAIWAPASTLHAVMPWAEAAFGELGAPLLAVGGTIVGLCLAGAAASGRWRLVE